MKHLTFSMAIFLFLVGFIAWPRRAVPMLSHVVDLEQQELHFFWKDGTGQVLGSFNRLREWLAQNNQELVFAMNGGMYQKDRSPQGLYIESQKVLAPIKTQIKGYGNFYLQPNGVFYITNDHVGRICATPDFSARNVKYATQSGPLLLINGQIHPKFTAGSKNLNIRNGVGILPNNQLLFAISKEKINFYDFALYFQSQGCKDALYLDGFISRAYMPEKSWMDIGGDFGVIIAETKPKK